MKVVSEEELVDLVKGWLQEHHLDSSTNNVKSTDETDLISTGLIDSFGFVELILFIEKETGYRVDLNGADPEEFTILRGLCNHVMRGVNRRRKYED